MHVPSITMSTPHDPNKLHTRLLQMHIQHDKSDTTFMTDNNLISTEKLTAILFGNYTNDLWAIGEYPTSNNFHFPNNQRRSPVFR